jgi:hypothetical protein
MIKQQMELEIGKVRVCPSSRRPQRRANRANWWFQRMRDTVDKALVWQSTPPARPEQTWFPQ